MDTQEFRAGQCLGVIFAKLGINAKLSSRKDVVLMSLGFRKPRRLFSFLTLVMVIPLGTWLTTSPSLASPSAPPQTAVDPASPAEILAQVRASSPTQAGLANMGLAEKARALSRCFALPAGKYCLGIGFMSEGEAPDMRSRVRAMRAERAAPSETGTGDLSYESWLAQRQGLGNGNRADAEVAEIKSALVEPNEAPTLAARSCCPPPSEVAIMGGYATRQTDADWCGPATMQSIDWADDGSKESQASWASDLGTTSSGTSIVNLNQQINAKTGWDTPGDAYNLHSVADWDTDTFWSRHVAYIGSMVNPRRPIVEHPELRDEYFNYLAFDHSGHFQVGRGYRENAQNVRYIRIFEVFNESDFTVGGNNGTWGPQEVTASKQLAATKANADHKNIGY